MERMIRVDAFAYLLGALFLILVPLRWGMAVVTAALIHEGFHLLMVFLCGGQLRRITVRPTGTQIVSSLPDPKKQALCIVAGPLGSFLLLALSRVFPEAALAGMVQGTVNLLPIGTLDGARLAEILLPIPVCRALEVFTLILLSGLLVMLWVHLGGTYAFLIPLLCIWLWSNRRKIPCKANVFAIQ